MNYSYLFAVNFQFFENKNMAPIPLVELIDELAVDVMDLQTKLSEESKVKHKDIIRKMLDKIYTNKKYSPIPEFEKGKSFKIIIL